MKLNIIAITVFVIIFSSGAVPAEHAGQPTRTSVTAPRLAGIPDFWQVAEDGRGTIIGCTEWVPGDIKLAASDELIALYGVGPSRITLQEFVTTFYLVGDDGSAKRLWVHRGIAGAGTDTPLKPLAVILTTEAFVILYQHPQFGICGAAVRPGAGANSDDSRPLRGYNLARASIAGPSIDGNFHVVVGDAAHPQNRYSVKFTGGGAAVWEWNGVWDASALAWRTPEPGKFKN